MHMTSETVKKKNPIVKGIKIVFTIILVLYGVLSIKQSMQDPVDPAYVKEQYTIIDAKVSALYEKRFIEDAGGMDSMETSRREARDSNQKIIPEFTYTYKGKNIRREIEYFGWIKTSKPLYSVGDQVEIWINKHTEYVTRENDIITDQSPVNMVLGYVALIIVFIMWFGIGRKKRKEKQ